MFQKRAIVVQQRRDKNDLHSTTIPALMVLPLNLFHANLFEVRLCKSETRDVESSSPFSKTVKSFPRVSTPEDHDS